MSLLMSKNNNAIIKLFYDKHSCKTEQSINNIYTLVKKPSATLLMPNEKTHILFEKIYNCVI